MNDMHQLHNQANDTLARRLHSELLAMRSGTGQVSQATESGAGSDAICTDAPGLADAGSNIASGKGET